MKSESQVLWELALSSLKPIAHQIAYGRNTLSMVTPKHPKLLVAYLGVVAKKIDEYTVKHESNTFPE